MRRIRRSLRAALLCWVLAALWAPAWAQTAGGALEQEAWVALSGRRVTVYHRRGQEKLAARVLLFLEEQAPLPALDPDVPVGVSAYLAPDPASFAALTGGRVPEWSAGVAIPSLARLVMPVYGSQRALAGERARVLRHEWAHLGLHQQLEGLRPPRWFDEGYAEWASGWDRSQGWQLRVLLASGRLPPLDSLTLDWPRDAASARAAYLLSATAMEYLTREGGERGLALLLERWKAGASFEGALRATYGMGQGQFEVHWRRYVKERYGWLMVLSHSMAFWSVLALLLFLLLRVRRRRDRERLARLRATEVPDDPDYWMGEEDSEAPPSGEAGKL